jgi:hypothetical protein
VKVGTSPNPHIKGISQKYAQSSLKHDLGTSRRRLVDPEYSEALAIHQGVIALKADGRRPRPIVIVLLPYIPLPIFLDFGWQAFGLGLASTVENATLFAAKFSMRLRFERQPWRT